MFLFLDMLEVSALDDLQRSLHPMRKNPANPVLRTGPPGAWDDASAVAYGKVVLDNGKFRMWYSGTDRESLRRRDSGGYRAGYAESEDGIQWIKPVLDQVEHQGSTRNNIVDLGYRPHGHRVMAVKDERNRTRGSATRRWWTTRGATASTSRRTAPVGAKGFWSSGS